MIIGRVNGENPTRGIPPANGVTGDGRDRAPGPPPHHRRPGTATPEASHKSITHTPTPRSQPTATSSNLTPAMPSLHSRQRRRADARPNEIPIPKTTPLFFPKNALKLWVGGRGGGRAPKIFDKILEREKNTYFDRSRQRSSDDKREKPTRCIPPANGVTGTGRDRAPGPPPHHRRPGRQPPEASHKSTTHTPARRSQPTAASSNLAPAAPSLHSRQRRRADAQTGDQMKTPSKKRPPCFSQKTTLNCGWAGAGAGGPQFKNFSQEREKNTYFDGYRQ